MPKIIYVNKKAKSGGNGTSWCKAYNNLQSALDDSNAHPSSQIWVTKSTYTRPQSTPI